MKNRNLEASVRARLLSHVRQTGQDFNFLLNRYAIERLLYRIGISAYADRFLLKGALLFNLWFDIPHRPTRDADFLGFGSAELPHIESIFKEICSIDAPDGINYQPDTVRVIEIRDSAHYAGVRVTLQGLMDGARSRVQVDIGFGDAVTPEPLETDYPVIFPDFAAPVLRVYPHYTVVAEKFEALVFLAAANSRMKDYFDLWVLAHRTNFDGETLRQAIRATFKRRRTALPKQTPYGLSEGFTQDRQKRTQWQAFLRKNRLEKVSLEEVVEALIDFLSPVAQAAATDTKVTFTWSAGGPWVPQ